MDKHCSGPCCENLTKFTAQPTMAAAVSKSVNQLVYEVMIAHNTIMRKKAFCCCGLTIIHPVVSICKRETGTNGEGDNRVPFLVD